MMKLPVIALALHVCIQAQPLLVQQPDTYADAKVDPSGRLVILTAGGRTIVVAKEGEQTGFDKPVVSPERTAVGAQALFPNCCTSYDLPLQLVVYATGRVHRFRSDSLSIFWWRFVDRGTRVAYGATTPHFGCAVHYELREIDSERLIDSIDVPESGGMCGPLPPLQRQIPKWVDDLNSRR